MINGKQEMGDQKEKGPLTSFRAPSQIFHFKNRVSKAFAPAL